MNTHTLQKNDVLGYLEKLAEKGSFNGKEFNVLDSVVNTIGEQVRKNGLKAKISGK